MQDLRPAVGLGEALSLLSIPIPHLLEQHHRAVLRRLALGPPTAQVPDRALPLTSCLTWKIKIPLASLCLSSLTHKVRRIVDVLYIKNIILATFTTVFTAFTLWFRPSLPDPPNVQFLAHRRL